MKLENLSVVNIWASRLKQIEVYLGYPGGLSVRYRNEDLPDWMNNEVREALTACFEKQREKIVVYLTTLGVDMNANKPEDPPADASMI